MGRERIDFTNRVGVKGTVTGDLVHEDNETIVLLMDSGHRYEVEVAEITNREEVA